MSNTIRWYKSVEMDAPELNSPQPCPRGVHCDYRIEKEGTLVPACCRFVHPGEEGNGRRIFPARIIDGGYEQPACVRLTGGAAFYERRRLRLSWGEWCEKKGIPYTPVKAGERWEPVTLGAIGGNAGPPQKLKNRRKREEKAPPAVAHDTSVPPGRGCAGCAALASAPPPPTPLNLGGRRSSLNYGFSGATSWGGESPSLPLLATAGEDKEAGFTTLEAPISCSDLELYMMAADGPMEAVY